MGKALLVGGVVLLSTVDYPDYIASVILGYFWKGVGFVFRKANAVKISFNRSGASCEK